MKGKTLMTALMLLFVAIFAMASVNAQFVVIDDVEIDEDSLPAVLNLERGQEFEVKVHFTASSDPDDIPAEGMEEVEVEVELTGYDRGEDRVRDVEYVDEITPGDTYVERLTLDFPWDMDQQEQYTLRVYICPRSGDCVTESYQLDIEAQENAFVIKDVDFSPGLEIEAGRALLTTVRVENAGDEDDTDGVKVEVEIPELGLSASDYLDEVDEDDSASSEELYIRIPSTVSAGTYDVDIIVTHNDGRDQEMETYTLTVTAAAEDNSACCELEETQSKTVITVGPEAQDMVAGQGGAVYPVTLTNAAGEAKTYVVGVSGYDSWGSVRLDPSNVVVLGEGETQTVYLFVSADEEASGLYTFAVSVTAGSETLKEMLLTANVAPAQAHADGSWDSVKKGLEVGLIVLVVLLVILGLIIVVNKLRSQDDDEDEESRTYY